LPKLEVEIKGRPSISVRQGFSNDFGAPSSPGYRRLPLDVRTERDAPETLDNFGGVNPGSGKSVGLLHLAENMAIEAGRHPDERSILPIYV